MRQLETKHLDSVRKQLVAKQNNLCAVCGRPFTKTDRAVVDHDHGTGVIRGALHNSCNGVEGRLKARAHRGHKGVTAYEYLIGLGEYLKKHSVPQYQLIHPDFMTPERKRVERNRKARIARTKKALLAGVKKG